MKIMIIGPGTMGAGIAQIALQSGSSATIWAREPESLTRGINRIQQGLERSAAKQKITAEQQKKMLANLTGTTDISMVQDCDLAIEAAAEDIEVKKQLFQQLDRWAKPECILATNTSSLSITDIAMSTARPDRVIGMHFFNPAAAMKLVEIIKGALTSPSTFQAIYDLSIKWGKTPVEVEESPGFIVNRILFPMINEAAYTLMEGVASAADIDQALKLGAGHPLGPLELADLVGLDICLAIMQTLYTEFGDSKYRPCPLLKKMVRANKLGHKTGAGFYQY